MTFETEGAGGTAGSQAPAADGLPPGQYVTAKWPVLHVGPIPRFDPKTWDFRVAGLVEQPLHLTWEEFNILPRVNRRSDIHCVTTWSKYDNLWDLQMPFTMVMHQQPTDGREHPGCHFHIEFAPIFRSPGRLKYLAGCETGAGTFINDTRAEAKAQELRWAEPRT